MRTTVNILWAIVFSGTLFASNKVTETDIEFEGNLYTPLGLAKYFELRNNQSDEVKRIGYLPAIAVIKSRSPHRQDYHLRIGITGIERFDNSKQIGLAYYHLGKDDKIKADVGPRPLQKFTIEESKDGEDVIYILDNDTLKIEAGNSQTAYIYIKKTTI